MTERKDMDVMSGLLRIIGPLKWKIVISVIMGILANLATVAMIFFGMMAVLNVIGFKTPLELTYIFICMVSSVIVRSLFIYIEKNQ